MQVGDDSQHLWAWHVFYMETFIDVYIMYVWLKVNSHVSAQEIGLSTCVLIMILAKIREIVKIVMFVKTPLTSILHRRDNVMIY